MIDRREFLRTAGMITGAAALRPERFLAGVRADTEAHVPSQSVRAFETSDPVYRARYRSALDLLGDNTQRMPGYSEPVLIEGSVYRGVWLECAPQEGLVYAAIRPDIARNNHMAFFKLQREDGQLPCNIKTTETGHGQIQMVVPIAATAWELAQQTGDSELLHVAYESCSRWDAWLMRYRNTRNTGLCEGFCTYDTGHDNSPRWVGLPNRCPDADARKCPDVPALPRLSPDLSATVYGGRVALSAMAKALGRNKEFDEWLDKAAAIRSQIIKLLYSEEDAAFYDLDPQNKFVRIRGDVISRVLGEHVVGARLFEQIYGRQIHNPKAFWSPYPLPSIALDDSTFVRPIPLNSWGGASQALTALRAPRWMEFYGKPADLAHVMQKWVDVLVAAPDFRQQIDPLSGAFSADPPGYSPAALALMDFTWRLSGVRAEADRLEWNIRPQAMQTTSSFSLRVTPTLTAELKYQAGAANLSLNGKHLMRVKNTVRLITTQEGKLERAVGIGPETSHVVVQQDGQDARKFTIEPNSSIEPNGNGRLS